jgi:hypothetical protein
MPSIGSLDSFVFTLMTEMSMSVNLFVSHLPKCLFDCFESHEQFFSYLATVTITGDGAANLAVRVLLRATPTATRELRF